MRETEQKISDRSKVIDFIGIGNPRSGSSWISECLAQHPDISFSSENSRKEIGFFGRPHNGILKYPKGMDWYMDQFPRYQEGKIRGEFSPNYLTDDNSCLRIKNHFPNVKLLVALRNPVDFLYSLYQWEKNSVNGANLPDRFEDGLKSSFLPPHFVERGMYYKHLRNYFQNFPKENIFIILFDDIKNNPERLLRELYSFLEVKDDFFPTVAKQKINTSQMTRFKWLQIAAHKILESSKTISADLFFRIKKLKWLRRLYKTLNTRKASYPPISPETRLEFIKTFEDDIHELENLLGRDLSLWFK